MPDLNDDGAGTRNIYDTAPLAIEAYRLQIEQICPELAGRTFNDYPDQNNTIVAPPQLCIMNTLTVTRHRLGGTRKVRQTLDDGGDTWTRVNRTAFSRIIFQIDLWAENATQRGQIHAALMGQFEPYWVLNIGQDALAAMVIQHYRPMREGRKDGVARSLYQGFILTPELVQETLYSVKDIYIAIGIIIDKPPVLPPFTVPKIHFSELPDTSDGRGYPPS